MSDKYRLIQEIIAHSESKTWDEAKGEWVLLTIYYQVTPDRCICGHSPINEICILQNQINGNTVKVGNECVNKFMDTTSNKIFHGLNRIRKDETMSLNKETIELAFSKGWIKQKDYDFYLSIYRKRRDRLSQPCLKWKIDINKSVLRNSTNV